ncbi:MAG: hypothetical protein II945_08810 [Bacteroidales bacterium]|nr:hypothetical protein [Bacteroidales bacterium]
MAIRILIPSRTGAESAVVSAIKEKLYRTALSDIVIETTNEEKLLNERSQTINEVILHENVNPQSGVNVVFDDCKIDVVFDKEIKQTELINRNGTVKEYIYSKDYVITLKGTIRKEGVQGFPYEDLWFLQQILAINKKMYVSSKFLNGIYDITQVVVKKADFLQSGMNYFNVMPYSITLWSDTNYDFLVED